MAVALFRLPAGSTEPIAVASGLKGAKSLAARNGDVYWSTRGAFCNVGAPAAGGVFRFASGAGTTATVASGISGPDNLYADGVDLYFTTVIDELNDDVLAATAVPR